MTAEELIHTLQNMMQQLPGEGAKIMKEEIQSRITGPDTTGALVASVKGEGSGSVVVISANTPYATYFEDGRGAFSAHPPKTFLQWESPTYGYVRKKSVKKMEARHFAEPTAEKIVQFIETFN